MSTCGRRKRGEGTDLQNQVEEVQCLEGTATEGTGRLQMATFLAETSHFLGL